MAMTLETNWNRYESLKVRLGELKAGFDSPRGQACIAKVIEAVVQDNRDGLLRGLDKDGVPFVPLAASTLKHREGTGPPLAPHESASRVVANFTATEARSGNQVIVRVGWTGADFLRFHKTGTRHMPRRDPGGIRPAGRQRVKDIVRDFQRSLVRGDR